MAELEVQPKKKSAYWPWLLGLLALIAIIWFLWVRNSERDRVATDTTVTPVVPAPGTNSATGDWNIDFDAPSVTYGEITAGDIDVRGRDAYGIYSLGENVLFDDGKANIRSDAEDNLKQVAVSILKRHNGGEVRIYGYTDAKGNSDANKELARKRAEAVKGWLENNGIDADRISVNAVGEARPVASNATEEGRSQNRRVEIVARGGKAE